MNPNPIQLSLCIPTMNRWEYLKEYLPKYIANPYISEIVICDETGDDILQIQNHSQSKKLKLFQNESKLGAYKNKNKVVSLASHEFVCLMDSDNFADIDYFDAWHRYINNNQIDNLLSRKGSS